MAGRPRLENAKREVWGINVSEKMLNDIRELSISDRKILKEEVRKKIAKFIENSSNI